MACKLLFDENLAPRLVGALAELFPGSAHVPDFGLARAADEAIWQRAAADDFVIVTKDDDFRQRSFLHGHPPKIVWLRVGNCATADVAELLRARHPDILRFVAEPTVALLVLNRGR